MKRSHNILVLKAARQFERDAEVLRETSAAPKSDPPVWPSPKDAKRYHEWRRMALRLRALTLEANP